MANDDKRVIVRLDPETWQRYDDKRHNQRTSFQQLGETLFRQWFQGRTAPGPISEHPLTTEIKCPECSALLRVSPDSITPEVVQPAPEKSGHPLLSPAERTLLEQRVGRLTDDEITWIKKLLYIMRNDPETAPALEQNLERFFLLSRILTGEVPLGNLGRTAEDVEEFDSDKGLARARELGARHLGGGKNRVKNEAGTKKKQA
ncbi:MAG: hypothetical protein ABFD60_13105 [Bryobacteraceae bacterium]